MTGSASACTRRGSRIPMDTWGPRAFGAVFVLVDERERATLPAGPSFGGLLRGDPDEIRPAHEGAGPGRGDSPDVPVLRGWTHHHLHVRRPARGSPAHAGMDPQKGKAHAGSPPAPPHTRGMDPGTCLPGRAWPWRRVGIDPAPVNAFYRALRRGGAASIGCAVLLVAHGTKLGRVKGATFARRGDPRPRGPNQPTIASVAGRSPDRARLRATRRDGPWWERGGRGGGTRR